MKLNFPALLVFLILNSADVYSEKLDHKIIANKAIDLSHTISEEIPIWPGGVPFKMNRLVDYDQGYRLHSFFIGENTGTHLDAPSHFIKGNKSVNELELKNLVVKAVVIDIQAKTKNNPDYELTAKDVLLWEKENEKIPSNSLVILNTGWHKKFSSPKAYVNMDKENVMHFPGYGYDSAKLLLERNIAGIGIDTLSLDFGGSKKFKTHVAMLKANKYQLENLANLDAMPATGASVIVGVLPIKEGSQAQARVIALLN